MTENTAVDLNFKSKNTGIAGIKYDFEDKIT